MGASGTDADECALVDGFVFVEDALDGDGVHFFGGGRDAVGFAAAHPELHRFMLQEGAGENERLVWLVATHVRPTMQLMHELFAELEASGRTIPARPDHLFYMLIGAASTPYALAPEFELTSGEDPFAKEMVEAHAEAVLQLFFPKHRHNHGDAR